MLIWRARLSEKDLSTAGDWAKFVGVSPSSLRELCRLVRVKPHRAHALARMFRAVLWASSRSCPVEDFLRVADRRTLRILFQRAGLEDILSSHVVQVTRFLGAQQFVDVNHEVVHILYQLLGSQRGNERAVVGAHDESQSQASPRFQR